MSGGLRVRTNGESLNPTNPLFGYHVEVAAAELAGGTDPAQRIGAGDRGGDLIIPCVVAQSHGECLMVVLLVPEWRATHE